MSYKITDKCIGCSLCKRGCPVGAVEGDPKSLHSINANLCINCGLCGKLCPKCAILDEEGKNTKKIPKNLWLKPSISRKTCVGCSICVVTCPTECLKIESAKFHGDIDTIAILSNEDNCIGCTLCAKACPIDAITMK